MDPSAPTRTAATAWHICWQASTERNLLAGDTLVERIRGRLFDAHDRRGRELVDYLLTPTEIHVLSRLAHDDSPGELARAVANIVARWVREVQDVRGPVFAGRYRAHRVGSDAAMCDDVRVLAWRPVTLGLCTSPKHHAHSALRTALGLRLASGFDARPLLNLFGDTVPAARKALRMWVGQRPTELQMRQWELSRGLALAIGTVGPPQRMAREVRGPAAALVAAGGADGIDGALRSLEYWVLARQGPRGVDRLAGAPGPGGARGRALVACLAIDIGLCSAASVARHFQRAKATLSEQMKACRRRPEIRQILETPRSRIVEEAIALRSRPQ